MAYSTISKPSLHFDNKTYLGSSNAVTVSGLGFQPDWVWVKDRDNGNEHCLVDAVRGVGKYLRSNNDGAEINNSSQSISAFTSDGFTTGTANPANESGSTTLGFISWNWKANGAGSSNSDGSTASTVSVNTTAGFSIVSYTGTGSATTVGHGLGVAPGVVIVRNRNTNSLNWRVYHHKSAGQPAHKHLALESTQALGDAQSVFNDTEPTSTVFSVANDDGSNKSSSPMIAYCFAEKKGYSKFGAYNGNGNVNGNFLYTGFKPAWFIQKRTDNAGNWAIFDNLRANPFNEITACLEANQYNVEQNNTGFNDVDFLSNGIKIREDNGDLNTAGGHYIYMAFAEEPLVANVGANGVPATAR
tara:strand:+ start:15 stop:1088 length:1074 start_codon:yes stop_codon:yes gene_type:complete